MSCSRCKGRGVTLPEDYLSGPSGRHDPQQEIPCPDCEEWFDDEDVFQQPMMTCPQCGVEEPDFDGFGMLAHVQPYFSRGCGWCSHPARTGNLCEICGEICQGGL